MRLLFARNRGKFIPKVEWNAKSSHVSYVFVCVRSSANPAFNAYDRYTNLNAVYAYKGNSIFKYF